MKEPTQKDLCSAIMKYDFKYLKTERSKLAAMRSHAGTSGKSMPTEALVRRLK